MNTTERAESPAGGAVPFPRPHERGRPVRLGPLALCSRYLLAPLAGYTNLSFRLAMPGVGGLGRGATDLVNARALLQASRKTMDLLQTCPEDRPLAVQIYGADPADLMAAARWLEEYGASSVDINMGCPVHKVTRGGGGSALLCNAVSTVDLVARGVESGRIPVTVKMRLGWDGGHPSGPDFARPLQPAPVPRLGRGPGARNWAPPPAGVRVGGGGDNPPLPPRAFARRFEQAGVAAVIIHGRTRAQGFKGPVNLDGIRAVVEAVERIPVIG